MKQSGLLLVIVFAGFLLVRCGPELAYRMVRPQASATNHYIGPDLEVGFEFAAETILLTIQNNGDAEILVDWDRATFVRADGRATKLLSAGTPLIGALPLGSVTQARLTLAEWGYMKGGIWNRRAHLKRYLVPPVFLERCAPMVRIALPIRRLSSTSEQYEMMEFLFQVNAVTEDEPEGGGYGDSPLF
jgi:hypothetical protein